MKEWIVARRIRAQLMLIVGVAVSMALLMAGAVVAVTAFHDGRHALTARLETQAPDHRHQQRRRGGVRRCRRGHQDAGGARCRPGHAERGGCCIRMALVWPWSSCASPRPNHSGFVEVEADVNSPDKIGSVRLRAQTGEVDATIVHQIEMLSAVLTAALLLALMVSSRLQALISVPLSALAGAAGAVTESRDFSVRVPGARLARGPGPGDRFQLHAVGTRGERPAASGIPAGIGTSGDGPHRGSGSGARGGPAGGARQGGFPGEYEP